MEPRGRERHRWANRRVEVSGSTRVNAGSEQVSIGMGIWRTNRTGVHRGLVVATPAALLIGSASSTTTPCVTAENWGAAAAATWSSLS